MNNRQQKGREFDNDFDNFLFSNCPKYTLFAPQILHKPLVVNGPGSIAFSQEHFKTISYAKFGGQTEFIMGNWKIVNDLTFVDLSATSF